MDISNQSLNDSWIEGQKEGEEMSFFWINSDDELETHERDGSPVVRMNPLDQTVDTLNYQTHTVDLLDKDFHDRLNQTLTNSPGKTTDWSSTMVVKQFKEDMKDQSLTFANLNKIENKSKRSMMGSSLINAAFNDVQKVNKVKSEYNAAPNNFIKAG